MPLLLTVLALLLAADDPKPDRYPRPELLIEAAELMKPGTDRQLRVLDARGKAKYLEGHIPGAVWVDHTTWARAFAADPSPEAWARRIGALGIGRDTPVVVYDDSLSRDAARIWWILRYWGIRDVRLLHGGWAAWQNAGGPVAKEPATVASVNVKLQPEAGRLATKDQVRDVLKAKNVQIVDTRSEEEFCGTAETAKRSGAIPGALHLEWSDLLDPKTQRFKPPDELARLFEAAGIDPAKPAVTYCQSGGRASVMAFALELMGGTDVKNYYRSWSEWGNADDTPIVKPPSKQ